jgi:hypothetical protein
MGPEDWLDGEKAPIRIATNIDARKTPLVTGSQFQI